MWRLAHIQRWRAPVVNGLGDDRQLLLDCFDEVRAQLLGQEAGADVCGASVREGRTEELRLSRPRFLRRRLMDCWGTQPLLNIRIE